MTNLKRYFCVVATLLILATNVIGCTSTSEGGIVGSGISSIQGNIVEVEAAAEARAATASGADGGAAGAPLPVVVVSVDESAGSETTTDAAGEFRLEGDFAGTITIRFRDIADDTTLGTFVIEIGAGATVVLSDIEIRADLPDDARVQVRPPLQINLFGRVTARDCEAGRLEIVDESPARNHFVLRVRDDSEIVNADDSAEVSCDRIRIDDRVTVVEGIVDRDEGLIEAIKLRVQPVDPVPPPVVRVRRRGIVVRTACARGFVHFQDTVPNDLVSARLTGDTAITCGPASRPCRCEDIAFGDMIDVVGTRRADNARSIEALRLQAIPNPATAFVTTAAGDVASIDCAGQILRAVVNEVSGDAVRPQEIVVRLSAETIYRCFGLACACADVRPRDRIALEALVSVDQSTVPEALAITVVTAARLRVAGVIDAVDCGAGQLRVAPDADPLAPISFQIIRATQFVLPDGSATTCRRLGAGVPVGVSGHVERGVPGAVRRNVADLVRVERQRR